MVIVKNCLKQNCLKRKLIIEAFSNFVEPYLVRKLFRLAIS